MIAHQGMDKGSTAGDQNVAPGLLFNLVISPTLGFSDEANPDEGAMWPTSFALKQLTAADDCEDRRARQESGEMSNKGVKVNEDEDDLFGRGQARVA